MATRLALDCGYGYGKPASLLNSVFMSTVNTAAKTLVSVASNAVASDGERWRAVDHGRYALMLMIWFTVWVLRVMIDLFPFAFDAPSRPAILDGFAASGSASQSLVLQEEFFDSEFDGYSTKAVGRALSHIFAILNEIPATSRKYQFAIAMADKIVDENAREGDETLKEINRSALSTAFSRTMRLLYSSLQNMQMYQRSEETTTLSSSILQIFPLASYILASFRGIWSCLGNFFPIPAVITGSSSNNNFYSQKQLTMVVESSASDCVVSEKLAQELLWITNKLRFCNAIDEAIVQWSFASGLASTSISANPRVQGSIVKISAILFRDLARGDMVISREVKFRLLVLWLPLFCFSGNGLIYPILTGWEKTEMEKVIEEVILSLPIGDQEIILANWLQDFTSSSSDWPNLQRCYDKWCRSSRKQLLK